MPQAAGGLAEGASRAADARWPLGSGVNFFFKKKGQILWVLQNHFFLKFNTISNGSILSCHHKQTAAARNTMNKNY